MEVSRRTLLKGGLGAGALVLAGPQGALAQPLRASTIARTSPLAPGFVLVHADLHNHSLQSDGDGDPAKAFATMRRNGIDVAALTDHTSVSYGLGASPCGGNGSCQGLAGMNDTTWEQTRGHADAADAPGDFIAIRGFEWSSPTLGHFNVWFSEKYIDPLHTAGLASSTNARQLYDTGAPATPLDPVARAAVEALIRAEGTANPGMQGFYSWLRAHPDRALLGGGIDAIGGFNHPGREQGRFGNFAFPVNGDPLLRKQVVSIEVFNRSEDYLFEGTDTGAPSPINQALDAGWVVGLLGVTDEHGTDWGAQVDPKDPYREKGRGGLWVRSLTREGVREALEARRFFATNLRGMRAFATLDGVPMGHVLVAPARRTATLRIDLDGPELPGREVVLQVLSSGPSLPRILTTETVVPRAGVPVTIEVPGVSATDTPWIVVRVVDPTRDADGRASAEYRTAGGKGKAIAYTSPFFVRADVGPMPVVPEASAAALLPVAGVAAAGAVLAARHHAHSHDHTADHGHDHTHA